MRMEGERESLQADIDKLASTIGCLENLDGDGGDDDDDQGTKVNHLPRLGERTDRPKASKSRYF